VRDRDHDARVAGLVVVISFTAADSSDQSSGAEPTCDDAQRAVQDVIDGGGSLFDELVATYFGGDYPSANQWLAEECGLGFE